MPSRKAGQLGVSGLGGHVAVKRAGAERRESDVSATPRDCGKTREKTHCRERDKWRRIGP